MVKIEVDAERCIGCGLCVTSGVCSFNLFAMAGDKAEVRDKVAECILCGECEKACPAGAIKVIAEND